MLLKYVFLLISMSLLSSEHEKSYELEKARRFEFTTDSSGRSVVLVYDAHGKFSESFVRDPSKDMFCVLISHKTFMQLPSSPTRMSPTKQESVCQEKQ